MSYTACRLCRTTHPSSPEQWDQGAKGLLTEAPPGNTAQPTMHSTQHSRTNFRLCSATHLVECAQHMKDLNCPGSPTQRCAGLANTVLEYSQHPPADPADPARCNSLLKFESVFGSDLTDTSVRLYCTISQMSISTLTCQWLRLPALWGCRSGR